MIMNWICVLVRKLSRSLGFQVTTRSSAPYCRSRVYCLGNSNERIDPFALIGQGNRECHACPSMKDNDLIKSI